MRNLLKLKDKNNYYKFKYLILTIKNHHKEQNKLK